MLGKIFILKLITILLGALLEISGIYLIIKDVKSFSTISIKSLLVQGEITSTHIGLGLIFFGVILQAIALLKTYQSKRKITSHVTGDLLDLTEEETEMCNRPNPKN
jgi:hypothetical protein